MKFLNGIAIPILAVSKLLAAEWILEDQSLQEAITQAEEDDAITLEQTVFLDDPLLINKKMTIQGQDQEIYGKPIIVTRKGKLELNGIHCEHPIIVKKGGCLSYAKQGEAQLQMILKEGSVGACRVQSGDREASLTISGKGKFCKEGDGSFVLSRETGLEFAGSLLIKEGDIEFDAELECHLEISQDAILRGKGTLGATKNKGLMTLEKGRLMIKGTYEQTKEGSLKVQISPGGLCGCLAIEGEALLSGKLEIEAQPGDYKKGSQYTILKTTGVIYGECVLVIKKGPPIRLKRLADELVIEIIK